MTIDLWRVRHPVRGAGLAVFGPGHTRHTMQAQKLSEGGRGHSRCLDVRTLTRIPHNAGA